MTIKEPLGVQGGQSATPDSKKLPKIGKKKRKKSGKIGEKEEKSGRKGKNREGSFTLPILTGRSGYATMAEFRSFVKYTKSNTKNIMKSISIHSDYQSVHF